MKPLLILDADGVLNAIPQDAQFLLKDGYEERFFSVLRGPTHYVFEQWRTLEDFQKWLPLKDYERPVFRLLYSPSIIEELLKLQEKYDFAWGTTWGEKANEALSPLFGLPQLPVIPVVPEKLPSNEWKYFFKTEPLLEWVKEEAPGRPFLWLDDGVWKFDKGLVAQESGGLGEAKFIHPDTGLTKRDLKFLWEWEPDAFK